MLENQEAGWVTRVDIEEKIELICRPPTEEVLTVDELRQLLETNEHPGHYIGFEISGMLHLGKFVVGSELYHNNDAFWRNLLRFSKHMTLSRTLRCMTIMGRSENENLDLSQYFYAPLQATDIHEIGADIPHGGMDQRKAHILAREVFPKMGWKN